MRFRKMFGGLGDDGIDVSYPEKVCQKVSSRDLSAGSTPGAIGKGKYAVARKVAGRVPSELPEIGHPSKWGHLAVCCHPQLFSQNVLLQRAQSELACSTSSALGAHRTISVRPLVQTCHEWPGRTGQGPSGFACRLRSQSKRRTHEKANVPKLPPLAARSAISSRSHVLFPARGWPV